MGGRFTAWMMVGLLGCGSSSDLPEAPDGLDDLLFDANGQAELPLEAAPPPGVLSMVTGPWVGAGSVELIVSGTTPGAAVRLFRGAPGGVTCPPPTAPDCLDLTGVRQLGGNAIADAQGVATFTFSGLPDPFPVAVLHLQALEVLAAGGANTSNVVSVETHDAGSDNDGDGLVALDEVGVYGTDPGQADTDGDGLVDGDEAFVFGTDPLNADTDGDGLADGDEVFVHGSDPFEPDTDAGGVLDGDEVFAGTNAADAADDMTWNDDIYPLFDSAIACQGCHTSGGGSGGMNMDDPSFVIGFPSNDVPSMARIEPFDPQNSYIWHKLNGTQASVGGAGLQMPRFGPYLDQASLDMVETFILQGANL